MHGHRAHAVLRHLGRVVGRAQPPRRRARGARAGGPGRGLLRLGVVWAGAQPRDEDALDPEFVRRLDAILDLTDRTGINVVLDNHGDMVGSLGCGNGVPAWFQKQAPGVTDLLGKPLETGELQIFDNHERDGYWYLVSRNSSIISLI